MWDTNDPMPEPDSVESVARTYTMNNAAELLIDAAARVDTAANFWLYYGFGQWEETRVACVAGLLEAHRHSSTVGSAQNGDDPGPSPHTVWQAAGLWSEGPTHYAAFGYLWEQYLELVCESIVGFMLHGDHESHIADALRLRWADVSDQFAASPIHDFVLGLDKAMHENRVTELPGEERTVTVRRITRDD